MRRKWGKGLSILLSGAMLAGSLAGQPLNVAAAPTGTEISETEMQELLANAGSADAVTNRSRVAVHDPSITKADDTYYVFGSHMGVASTPDLSNWTSLGAENSAGNALFGNVQGEVVTFDEAFEENAYQGKITTVIDGQEVELDFGTYNGENWITPHVVSGNMWAPDVIYNETMEKWCMYYSLNGPNWNSAVVLMTADEVTGPYCYQGPIVFTGFSTASSSKSFKNTDIELVLGEMDELPAKYQKITDTSAGNWGTWWPHAIDPSVFYDEEGNLWMAYGSWSGGIAMLELDEETGLRDYTVTYESDSDTKSKNWTTDAYFGKKIAGGQYVSGEGPYIEHIGDYYYLFMSYGGFAPDGGYEMRIFRSENPDGPYVDADGTNAIFTSPIYPNFSNANETRGEKLMANYKWSTMKKAEVAQGHNSAFVDEDGKAYVIYHTKFNDGTAGHEVRVHQLFVNEDGWLVTAPYEYDGETLSETAYATEQVVGEYDIIVHNYVQDYGSLGYESPKQITLNADGSITGEYTGTWTDSEEGPEITLVIDGHTYTGVLLEQKVDNTAFTTMCFTVCGDQGLCIWGSMQLDAKNVIAYNVSSFDFGVPERTWKDLSLPTEGSSGASITWASSNEEIMTADGSLVAAVEEDTEVTLTATIAKGDYYYNKSFDVMVMAGDGTYAEKTLVASYFVDEPQDLSDKNDGSLSVRNPFYNGNSKGLDITSGVTIEFDVESTGDVNVLGSLIGFSGGKLYFTAGSYLGYNATGGWFDANLSKQTDGYFLAEDYIGESAHVALHFTPDGFEVFVNDDLAYNQTILETETGDAGTFTDYSNILKYLNKTADIMYLGSGAWWDTDNAANATISNIECYVDAYVEPEDAGIIVFEKDEVVIEEDATCIEEENPFYGKTINTLYMEYTVNFADTAMLNGWDGIFSFYNSTTGARVSVQANPYVCFNDMAGVWADINWPDNAESADWAPTAEKGKDYQFTILITENDIEITVDGDVLAHSINGEGTNRELLDTLVQCDKLTWGTGSEGTGGVTGFWNSEICTVKDVVMSNYEQIATIAADEVNLTSASYIEYIDNPAADKEILYVEMDYILNFSDDAAKNGWDGIFAFYNSETAGRISMQTNPYLCYNIDEDGKEEWMDINNPNHGGTNWASGATKGLDYQIHVEISDEDVSITIDGEEIELAQNATNAEYGDLLQYIADCDQFTWGVGQGVTAYWFTEIATLSDVEILIACRDIEAEAIELDATELTLAVGEEGTLTATVSPEDTTDKTLIWSSSDETVATVVDGVVTAVAAGTANITVTTVNGLTATCVVTVESEADLLDVEEGWKLTAAQYVFDKGLMNGVDTDENGDVYFSPDTQLKREMLAQILYAAEDKPEFTTEKTFSDLAEGGWYVNAVLWAAENNIVSGIGDGMFGVDANITREQLALMLYKYAELKGYDVTATMELNEFVDSDSVNTWSAIAMKWAVANGVMSGKPVDGGTALAPQGEATRVECAAMLRSFMLKFVDVEAEEK